MRTVTFQLWTVILTKKLVIFFQKYKMFTKESHKKKTTLHFYSRCVSGDMFNPLNENLLFITYLIPQKNHTIIQCVS